MANKIVSFLDAVGKDTAYVFNDFIIPNTPLAETLVASFDPAISPIFNLVANTCILVEQKFAALGQQSGTGAQKLAQVSAIVSPLVKQYMPTGDAGAIITAIVGLLNVIPVAAK